ncbi:MAG: hypothetical protein OXI77_08870 [Chloroflexota bacterium]|nr:hypothetical protein [Chloroflexota bacterium]MDE2909674.1 hypothetical protein [Chloroflexota bacterium]
MIASELRKELLALNHAQKLAVVALLADGLTKAQNEEWERLAKSQQEFRFIPPIRIKPKASAEFLQMLEEESLLDG